MPVLATSVWDVVTRVELVIPVLSLLTVALIVIVGIVTYHWRHIREAEYDAALMRKMLEQGKSAADIERVITARRGGGDDEDD
ncbi:MAG: hypothetical protein KKB50_21455 [Planctomycetes bacterium]|nr:hypothetical protein [Planctomycetota bacterium]